MRDMRILFRRMPIRGVTLVELLFGMAIVAVLAGLAAPGFRSSLRAAAVRTGTYEILTGLQQARSQSILESRPGVLCPSDAAGRCLPAGTAAGFWQSSIQADGAPIALEHHPLPSGVTVRSTRSPLSFWPDALAASTGTLTICDTQGIAPPRAIVLSASGRARLATATEAACL
jgi:type IV fimbrial biogenesis protein FimT